MLNDFSQLRLGPTLLATAALAFSAVGCVIDSDFFEHCERGSGEVISEIRAVPFFDSIESNGSFDVLVSVGKPSVEVIGHENLVERIETRVSDGTMVIDSRDCFGGSGRVEVLATMPEVRELQLRGSGMIAGQEIIPGDDLKLVLDGSGDISFDVEVAALTSDLNGSGDIILSGTAATHDMRVEGSGSIEAFDLQTSRSDVVIEGSGDCRVHASDTLNVTIDGSGSVRYKGEPEISMDIDGSGDVEQAD